MLYTGDKNNFASSVDDVWFTMLHARITGSEERRRGGGVEFNESSPWLFRDITFTKMNDYGDEWQRHHSNESTSRNSSQANVTCKLLFAELIRVYNYEHKIMWTLTVSWKKISSRSQFQTSGFRQVSLKRMPREKWEISLLQKGQTRIAIRLNSTFETNILWKVVFDLQGWRKMRAIVCASWENAALTNTCGGIVLEGVSFSGKDLVYKNK